MTPTTTTCMRSYSPYDNPPGGQRPALLVTGAVHDAAGGGARAREVGGEAARDRRRRGRARSCSGSNSALGAHGGPSGRFAQVNYEAEVHAFVLDAMGITE